MEYIWTGGWPDNRSPQIEVMQLDSMTSAEDIVVKAGERHQAVVAASDPDGDALEYRWEIMHESAAKQDGGDKEEVPESVDGRFEGSDTGSVSFSAPADAGAYRLFVTVYDGKGHAGHANIPFLVE